MMRTRTMNATPSMCHQAETMFKAEVIEMLRRLMRTAAIRNAA
jgi:hypothetical protein